jgi:hypothetical protein
MGGKDKRQKTNDKRGKTTCLPGGTKESLMMPEMA